MTSVNNICAPTNKRSVGRPKKSVGAVVLPPSSTPPPPSPPTPQPLTLLLRANRPKSSSAPVDHPIVVVKRAYKREKDSHISAAVIDAKENARRAYLETVKRVEDVCSREFASDTARNLAFFWLSQRASFVV